jgi:predicted SAM-dependent methyltransferase
MNLGALKYAVVASTRHLNRPFAEQRMRAYLRTTGGPYKLNVGAGYMPQQGWLNTDTSRSARYWLDVVKPWPMPAGSCSFILADNVIEHLSLSAGRKFLRHAHQALVAGGVLRVVTPDAEALARLYLDGGPVADSVRAWLADIGRAEGHSVDLLRFGFSMWGHAEGYVYDEPSLRFEMESAGLKDILRVPLGESHHPDLRGVDARAGTPEVPTQVVLEATKL